MDDFSKAENELVKAEDEGKGEDFFEFREVCKAFDEHLVLDHVSFTVKRGETCVIMGRSGVGKSVSLKHVMGFLRADSGQVIVDGEDVTSYSENEFTDVRRKVTMVFQSGALFDSLTVGENIAFPLEKQPGLTYQDVDAYVARFAHMLELENVLDKLPSELSTGMKRAVAIGRALAQSPKAILYDEPTTMVDPIMAGHAGDLILRLKNAFNKTSIVVTHDTHLAKKLADVVVFLHEGRVRFFGPWDGFEKSEDPVLKIFRLEDELVPALDVTL